MVVDVGEEDDGEEGEDGDVGDHRAGRRLPGGRMDGWTEGRRQKNSQLIFSTIG